jgi:F-type H+-transporting ATPase subunit b
VAAESDPGVEAGAHGAGAAAEASLPQFDFSFFASQVFWLVLVFAGLYVVLSRALLPRIGGAIAARDNKVRSDLDLAKTANDKAQEARAGFEKSLAGARADARAKADAVRKAAAEARARAGAEADARLAERLAAAETRLAGQRRDGLVAARGIAAETAQAIVERLTGVSVPANAAAAAADRAAQS